MVARAEGLGLGCGIGDALQDKGVQTVVGLVVGAGEGFVNEEGKVLLIGEMDGVGEGVVVADAPVHLGPVEDVFGLGSQGAIIEGAGAFGEWGEFHLLGNG